MPTTVKFRRGTTAQNDAFTGEAGEISVDETLDTIRVHDGSTAGGFAMVSEDATQTLTNKTLTSAELTTPTVGGVSLAEYIADTIGAMVTSNTETNITVTYEDSDNTLDFVIGTLNQDTSGNAATATALETSRTISLTGDASGSASFDGTGDASITVTVADDSHNHVTSNIDGLAEYIADTVGAMVGSNTETGITVTYDDADNTLDFVIGTLNQDTTGNAATATALETARTIAGQSFDGTANISIATTDLTSVTSTADEVNLLDGSTAGTIVNSKAVVYGASGEVNATTLQIGGTSITSTAAELNILDGVTSTAAELNKLDGFTGDVNDLNYAKDLRATGVTATEFDYLDGVTSALQTQLNAKQATITGGATTIASSDLTATRALVSDGSGKVAVSAVTSTELGYLDGVTSAIQTQLDAKVAKSGSTMTGALTLSGDPTSANHAATKSYVDTIASAGLHYHDPVRAEVTTNFAATYDNGSSGVGATLTATSNGAFALGGVTDWSTSERVLIYNQSTAAQNGVYTVTTVGDGSTAAVLTRATDADSYAPSDSDALGEGDAFYVQEGDGAGELYVMTTSGTITFGTTSISFSQISSAQIYSGGTDITLSGTTFNLDSTISADTTGNAATADALSSAVTVSLSGDVSGSATFTSAGDTASITATIADDSHNHVTSNIDGLSEYIADTVGAMVTSNTESGITVTYQDTDNTLDFTVGTLNQDTTGNAATATALATARTIGGVSFDGTANINLPGVNTAGNQNTSGNAATATKLATARTIGGVSFDGSANINLPGVNTTGSQNTTGSAATLTTARTIGLSGDVSGSVSFDGSANATITATVADDSHNHVTSNIDGLAEYIADTVGAMVTSNTESGITVAYQDADNTLDFTIGTLNQDTTGNAATATTLTGLTSTVAELNKLDGYTGSVTELNYLDTLHATGVTSTEFDYLDGVTSNIQTQLNAKLASSSYTAADVLTKIKTVDGAGSGLDADYLDGISSASFLRADAADTASGNLTCTGTVDVNNTLTAYRGVGDTHTDTTNSGTVTPDFSRYTNFVWTLTGNVTLGNPGDEAVGQSGFFVFLQDGTGGRTLSLSSDYESAGGAGLTLSSTASAADVVPYIVIASNRILLGAPQLAFA